ncbi:MAG: hypothetical protein CSA42_00020 [Gammaproteobacteria bacterium]|nr:MAG: hypothetical protein CSA42_00020 [Gammaproteobacteria bacterium]
MGYRKCVGGLFSVIASNCERVLIWISRVQLLRLFRQYLHISPHQYCLNRRIQQARTLLKRGASLDDTAYELGFADQAHFQRTFKRYAAVTPLQYQRNK